MEHLLLEEGCLAPQVEIRAFGARICAEVHVCVDQTWQHGLASEVVDPRGVWNTEVRSTAYGDDIAAFEDETCILERRPTLAIDQCPAAEDHRLSHGGPIDRFRACGGNRADRTSSCLARGGAEMPN